MKRHGVWCGAPPVVLALCTACVATVIPPPAPEEPRPVFLLDHGRHASLILPAGDGTMVRYSYGDWRYYARRKTGVIQASTAVLWPTRAGLGRRELASPPTSASVRQSVRVGIEHMYELTAGAEAIRQLRHHLDSIFRTNTDTHLYNPAYDLDFVHHPRSYWVFHNSNQVVARWLRQLGCAVRGPTLLSRWRVRTDGR